MFNIRVAAALLTLAETDIRQAEKASKKKNNSSPSANHSPAHTETDHTTHSENLPTAPSTEEETIWHEFQIAYAKLPHPALKEPILYVEEKKEHDDSVLLEIQQHYHELKDNLTKLAAIPITCLLYTSPSPRD